ncbi:MAG: DegV family protein [Eubacteriales bacterium]|nr:DegV family protein [Eubacteriales bacterium]
MQDFVLSTDSTADLPLSVMEEMGVRFVSLDFTVDGEQHGYRDDVDLKYYYDRMREGMRTSTSQAGMQEVTELFTESAAAGRDVLHISFSSELSGSYNTECMVAKQIEEEYPGIRIVVVNSRCASGGQGLLVRKLVEKKAAGCSLDELAAYAEDLKRRVIHLFTVDDLVYLYRGGRVSKAKTVLTKAINIKPLMHCNIEGKLLPYDKARGRKKALQRMADDVASYLTEDYKAENPYIIIGHADSLDDAKFLGERLTEKYGFEQIIYEWITPTIGAHSGPGTIALFFVGNERRQ